MIGIERIAMPRNEWRWPPHILAGGNVSGIPTKGTHAVLKDTVAAYPRMMILARQSGKTRVNTGDQFLNI
jgi:hypothetical protein